MGPVIGAECKQRVSGAWNNMPKAILEAAERLKEAEIENIDALKLIKKYNRNDCLIYADTPYLLTTRSQRYYNIEMTENDEHEKLIKVLKKHRGSVMISSYNSDLYNDLLSTWYKTEIETSAEQGKKRIEVIWTNFEVAEQLSLFG